ncbi:hypothetical protein GCM10029978_100380 [Actinoallomurus acanthiterrae]
MNTMPDDLLRDALSDAAATVTPSGVRPLTTPVRSRRRWAVPAGVVAVAAAVAAITLITIRPSGQTPAAPRMTLAAYAGAKYVLVGAWPGGAPVSVNDAATGKQIGQVPTPRGTTGFWDAAGTGDNRTFFLTTVEPKRSLVHFYRLRLRANGTPEQLSELPQATLHGLRGEGPHLLAVTNGGTKLAYVTATGAKATHTNDGSTLTDDSRIRARITIIDPASGDQRRIDLPQGTVADDLIWAPDGRHLAFTDETSDGLRILDPATGTIKPIESASGGALLGGAVIAPDSMQIVALASSAGKIRLVWYSLATLKITRDVALGRVRTDAPSVGPAISGNTVLMMIGDDLYRVTGIAVHKQHLKKHEEVDMGSEGTW